MLLIIPFFMLHLVVYFIPHISFCCCMFCPSRFTLLLLPPSLCAFPRCCLFLPLCFALLLFAHSLTLHFAAACSLPCTSLCNCLILLSCLVLLLHAPSFALHPTIVCSFPHVLPYFLPTPSHLILCSTLKLKYCYHSLLLVVSLPAHSHFTLMFALCQLVLLPLFHFYKLKNLD